jgi:DNA-binding phage protein
VNYIKDIENDINHHKSSDLISIVGKKSNLTNIFISIVFNTNYYSVKKPLDINDNLLNLIETSGLRFVLIDNCFDGTKKYENYKKIFNELISKKIKILILEKEKSSLDAFFKNKRNIPIFTFPKLSDDKDIIPDLSNALLTFHLNKNPNILFKVLDSSALNSLRNYPEIESIDQLDEIIISLIKSTNELIKKEDVESFLSENNNVNKKNLNTDINFLYEKPLKESRDLFEAMYLNFHLSQNKSITELSKKTGIERTHLYRKLKQLGIKV